MRIPRPWKRLSTDRKLEIYRSIADMSTPRPAFYMMVGLSTVIAAYGLLANSAAVVIGAMLVAPLMGPIFGVGLSLDVGDRRLLRQALFSEALGVIVAVALAAGIGLLAVGLQFGSEIMSRTQPTLYDIIIALASGLAGAYAVVDERMSPVLPGVAVATALVPPLAVCGLSIAGAHWEWAAGAFLLFAANFLAIEMATAAVFGLYGVSQSQRRNPYTVKGFLRRFAISLIALAVIGFHMTRTLLAVTEARSLSHAVQTQLTQELGATLGARLDGVQISQTSTGHDVTATVLTPRQFDPGQVAQMQTDLRRHIAANIHLVVRSLIASAADASGPVFVLSTEKERQAREQALADFLRQASQVLTVQLAAARGARLVNVQRSTVRGQTVVTAVVYTHEAISPVEVATAEMALRRTLGSPVRLVVRSLLSREADDQTYLDVESKPPPPPLTGAALKLRQRLESALGNQLGLQIPGSQLVELHQTPMHGRQVLLAVARTPQSFTPAQVKVIEGALRKYVQPNIDLTIRSEVGMDASDSSYSTPRELPTR